MSVGVAKRAVLFGNGRVWVSSLLRDYFGDESVPPRSVSHVLYVESERRQETAHNITAKADISSKTSI